MAPHPYLDPRYAAAIAAGSGTDTVVQVAAWQGAPVLRRAIAGSPHHDAAGPYPMLPWMAGWNAHAARAELAATGLVSLTFVSDPAHAPPDAAAFDHAAPFKTHQLVRAGLGYRPSAHHAQELRRAARRCSVAEVALGAMLPDWTRLYAGLVAARGFAGGTQDFAPDYFTALAGLGARAWAAHDAAGVIAMALWLRHDTTAYYHLAASSEAGRRASAAYALVDAAIEAFLAEGVDLVVLGGAAGGTDGPEAGLARFKAGFANATARNLVCGMVLDRSRHAALCAARPCIREGWFPAYRAPAQDTAQTTPAPATPAPAIPAGGTVGGR